VVDLPDVAMLYLLAVMGAAVRFGRGPSIAAAALSTALYDFFLVPPYYTFAVSDFRHLLTFAMLFVVGLVISTLALRIRRQEEAAREREERTGTLYALARELGSALDEREAARAIARHAARVFECGAAVLVVDGAHGIAPLAAAGELALESAELGVARWVLENERPAGAGTDTLPGARIRAEPLRAGARTVGVLALGRAGWRTDDRQLLDAFARQGALALERARLAEEGKAAALHARTEEMRSALLSAVSHDLRTPLAAIAGAASALRDEGAEGLEADQRGELLDTIREEAGRLERLLANLLDMTRLESGAVVPKREWVPLEEIVGAVLGRLDAQLAGREIHIELPEDLPLVSADPMLLEQLVLNLVENAAKHTPPGTPIEIRAHAREDVELEVADRGPGLPPGSEGRVFEKFFRGARGGPPGAGLGLAIARAIAEAHGGTLDAQSRAGGGAVFRLSLPRPGPADSEPAR
jgi:two-component system sensor histidine kinase KdpD